MRTRMSWLVVPVVLLVLLAGSASVVAQASASPAPPTASGSGVQPSGGVASLPPNGTWVTAVSAGELLAVGAPDGRFGGIQTWTLHDGTGTWRVDTPDGGFTECQASYAVVGDLVRFTYTSGTDCVPAVDDIRWTLDEAGLHITLVATEWGDFNETAALWGTHPWTMVTASPVPSGSGFGG